MNAVIATYHGDGVIGDDRGALRWLDRTPSAPALILVAGNPSMSAIALRYGREGDVVGGGPAANVTSLCLLQNGQEVCRIRSLQDAWGTQDAAEAQDIAQGAADLLGREADTGGAAAARLIRESVPKNQLWLPPKLQYIARDAIFQGPQSLVRGGAARATLYDQSSAYLREFYDTLPHAGVATIRRAADKPVLPSFIERRWCRVSGHLFPCLPTRWGSLVRWAYGPMFGALTSRWWDVAQSEPDPWVDTIAPAEERLEARGVKWLARCADRIVECDSKALRRVLYTRVWGMMSFQGYFTAPLIICERTGRLRVGCWTWTEARGVITRPDAAAVIAAGVAIATCQAALAAGGELLYCGLDSVAIEDEPAIKSYPPSTAPGDGWTRKAGTGAGESPSDFRGFATGVYYLGEHVAACGWTKMEEPTRETLGTFAENCEAAQTTETSRVWDVSPRLSADATSMPPANPEPAEQTYVDGAHPGWTSRGWTARRREPGDETEDAPRLPPSRTTVPPKGL